MSYIPALLFGTSILYTGISYLYLLNHQYGLSLSFFLYGVANVSLYASGRGW